MAHPYWPLFDLRVRTPRVELRYPDDDIVCRLVALAAKGIHDPDYMPFSVPWTDAESPEFERNALQFFWRNRAGFSVDDWDLPMAVFVGGEVAGVQNIGAKDFVARRVVGSGSWLGRDFQGQGIGKEMRSGVLHLAFAGLGAERAESGAWDDNKPSLGVSGALGYAENGDEIALRRGRPHRQIRLVLTRDHWQAGRRDDITVDNLDPCLPMFGLDRGTR